MKQRTPTEFALKTGKIFVPLAQPIRPKFVDSTGAEATIQIEVTDPNTGKSERRTSPQVNFCILRQGCYQLSILPGVQPGGQSGNLLNSYLGTLRIENNNLDQILSGDLYQFSSLSTQRQSLYPDKVGQDWELFQPTRDTAPLPGTIPIYPRHNYLGYLLGAKAFFSVAPAGENCDFSLEFSMYDYQHPSGTFKDSTDPAGVLLGQPDRTLRLELSETTPGTAYRGYAYANGTLLGQVSLDWLSLDYRTAELEVHTYPGAAMPVLEPGGGPEDFSTIFKKAGWDLKVSHFNGHYPSPPPQVPDECWAPLTAHALMQSISSYDPAILDEKWRGYLLVVPAKPDCNPNPLGFIFDNPSGDANSTPREGAITYSDGTYSDDNDNYGSASGEKQNAVLRAFLRSAAHEVGHIFNLFHTLRSVKDNSIMTISEWVAEILANQGNLATAFPQGIILEFNEFACQQLRHFPDPAVRPGAMQIFGNYIQSPFLRETSFFEPTQLRMDLAPASSTLRIGEPLPLKWTLTNASEVELLLPDDLSMDFLTARISVTDPEGKINFIKVQRGDMEDSQTLSPLPPQGSREAGTLLFWGENGFAFSRPGVHTLEIILLWSVEDLYFAVSASQEIYVEYPLSREDNEVARWMLNPEIGKFLAGIPSSRYAETQLLLEQYSRKYKSHPAGKRITEFLKETSSKGKSKEKESKKANPKAEKDKKEK